MYIVNFLLEMLCFKSKRCKIKIRGGDSMKLFIIGDVHGCLNTLKELIETNWDKNNEKLIFVGDLIDRGNFSPETVSYCRGLIDTYGDQVLVLLGNHEKEYIDHFKYGPNYNWLVQGGRETIRQYVSKNYALDDDLAWFESLPLYYEDEHVFVSHAGIADGIEGPIKLEDSRSIIWNRSPLKTLDKMQVIGHTPHQEGPIYNGASNSLNIDTGAVYGGKLTGVKIDAGSLEVTSIDVLAIDIQS